jgi:hypothetical protein
MKIEVENIKENEDGSADCIIFVDEEAKNFLIRYALIHCMMEAAELGKKATPPEGQDEH